MKQPLKLSKHQRRKNSKNLLRILNARQRMIRELKERKQREKNEEQNIMITKEQAVEIAKDSIPDIDDRKIFQISLEKPEKASILGNIPEDCWYITYSHFTNSSLMKVLFSADGIFINKYNGEVVYQGSIMDEG